MAAESQQIDFRKDAVAHGCRYARIEMYSAVLREVV